MRIRYTLQCQSNTARHSLANALRANNMKEGLHTELNYIITEFCNFTTPDIGEHTYIPLEAMRGMELCLIHFLTTGFPNRAKAPATIGGSVSGFVRRVQRQIAAEEEALPSPTRPYNDEDYECAELCLKWLQLGIAAGAYIHVNVPKE
jgi:hypothetical protein